MTICPFKLDTVHPSWQPVLQEALTTIHPDYLNTLSNSTSWLPGPEKIFNAFSLPIEQVNYVLFGESPYPRQESANGYAFWDNAVHELWSPEGLSKKVNRATSMRNIMKMLLVAEGLLSKDNTTQPAIAAVDKSGLVQLNEDLFCNLLTHGFLLLNATPVLQANGAPQKDARAWQKFMSCLLKRLMAKRPDVEFILLGNIANTIDKLIENPNARKLYAEHPYNHTFVTNQTVLDFFKPLHLLRKKQSIAA